MVIIKNQVKKNVTIQYAVYTMAGGHKIRALVTDDYEHALNAARVLTEGAASNPRNPSPAHWIEEVII